MKPLNPGRAKPLRAARRLTRSAVLIGVAGATAGSLLFGAAAAQAASSDPSGVGQDPTGGTLTFTDFNTNLPVTSGSGSELLKFNTSDACPAPTNVSGAVATFDPDTNAFNSFASNVGNGPGPYAGIAMQVNVQSLFQNFTDQTSSTFELAVVCNTLSTESLGGTHVFYQYTYINYNSTANTWAIVAGPPAKTATTTTLTSADTTNTTLGTNTANVGESVTFTAHVTDADSTTAAGTVTFQSNGTNIGTEPVTLSGGQASASSTFSAAGPFNITAVFAPSNATTYASSNASLTETVQVAGSITATVPENLTVPNEGTFTISVDTAAIPITAPTGSLTATGDFGTQSPTGPNSASSTAGVEVIDSRNTFNGWSVTGQTSAFTGPGSPAATISGNQLGWAPNTGETFATSGTGQATLGGTVTPAAPGLGSTAAMLISAPVGGGFGTFDASALLTLLIPPSSPPGAYAGTLTITAITHG
jgi:hypothetical protein